MGSTILSQKSYCSYPYLILFFTLSVSLLICYKSNMMKEKRIAAIKEQIASYPDFPKKGIIFRDFLPVMRYPNLFDDIFSLFEEYLSEQGIKADCVVGIESRGFLLGPTLALRLKVPFVPVRKPGKLAGNTEKECYSLEYGKDVLEIQTDAITKDMKVIVIDDLLATGGTLQATIKLVEKVGGVVEKCLTVIELNDLNGRKKLSAPYFSLIQY